MKNLSTVRGFLLDMDGTIFIGEQLISGAARFLEVLSAQGKEYLFLSNNSSRNRRSYAEKITRMGIRIAEEKVLTSGEAAARFIHASHPGDRLYVVGTPDLEEDFRSWGFVLDAESPDRVVLGFDTTLTYNKLWKLCNFVRGGLPFIATHPDINCPTETGFMPDIGAMIAFVKASTGREPDIVIGKPNRLIVDTAAEKINLPVDTLAMIGDRLYTDIAMGQTSPILTVLVLSGETKKEDLEHSPFKPDYVFKDIGEAADYLSLFWDG